MTNGRLFVLATLAIVMAACGGQNSDGGGGSLSIAELKSRLPAAGDLGLEQQRQSEWDNARDLLVQGLVIPEATTPRDLGAAMEAAGFQAAVGSALESPRRELHVRISVARFDSEEGALAARDLLHAEDLKQPCRAACLVAPREYELADIPDSAAVHHVPAGSEVEAHHAEFVIGPRLYVVQADGRPSATFSAEFDSVMRTVHDAASGAYEPSRARDVRDDAHLAWAEARRSTCRDRGWH
jgi:hypothetical protein